MESKINLRERFTSLKNSLVESIHWGNLAYAVSLLIASTVVYFLVRKR